MPYEHYCSKVFFWLDWKEYLLLAKNDASIHRYSPAKHNIICCGKEVSPRPSFPRDIYNRYKKKKSRDEEVYAFDGQICSYIDFVLESKTIPAFRSNVRNIPTVSDENASLSQQVDFLEELFAAALALYKRKVKLTHSEAVFNDFLVEPFLKVVSYSISEEKYAWLDVGFFPGEEHLLSMTRQLKQKGQFKDGRFCYNADGVIRLQDFHDIEVCVAEVSGVFKNTDMTKVNFDHHKGMFAVLSMLKTVADELKYASLDIFQTVKIFFVHAAEDKVKLWSLEDVLEIKPDFKDKEEFLKQTIRFYWNFKNSDSSRENIKQNLKQARYSFSPPPLLSQLVNPSIVRLTEKDHCKGMASYGPFDSPEHD
ncbi:uncharacterized protein EV154DRAFT_543377 [Mucor mucedo]|uniref:uncharacterized protein n=1 Tax=Mucor mucedo TaxID=29922 RepID=UPI00221FA0F2|nr:uncharacterized protein EV154DRAFT_543377 [Mucor mucedo]KAI7892165.1 hypothetical protein EV154DRAFT_543377 [Mucor mucedo]